MCNRHSFILTRTGKVYDGGGLTDSHTTIRELAGLVPEDDRVNAYEWTPPKGWPESDWTLGLVKDVEVFYVKASHLNAMKAHVVSLYPDMDSWNKPDAIRDVFKTVKTLRCDITIPEGATLTAPALTEVAGSVVAREGATLTAPALTEVAGYVVAREGATLTAPALTKAGYVVVREGATLTAPALTEVAGYVVAREGATLTAPALKK